jgi:hypothetical protein
MIVAARGGRSPDKGGKRNKQSERNILDEFHKIIRFIRSVYSHAATRWFRSKSDPESRIAQA